MNTEKIREDFPNISRELSYLDNAATTQKPIQVINRVEKYYKKENANVGRGLYDLASKATIEYQQSREKVADFLNAKQKEIIFVRNTTEAVNLVANSLDIEGEIVLPEMEHHSNQLPWRQTDQNVKYIPTTKDYKIDMEKAEEIIGENTGLIAVSHSSNVFGFANPIEELSRLADENDAYIFVDAAQTAPRRKIDVESLDVDFLAISGHKMLGPTGIGALYGKKELLEDMDPYQTGGGMIQKVKKDEIKWENPPHKFEAGTPNIAGAIGLKAAIEYLEKIGLEKIEEHEHDLTHEIRQKLSQIEGIKVLAPKDKEVSAVSFTCSFAHPHDIAEILNQENVAVRAGHHCAQPQMEQIDSNGAVRASPYIYNDQKDVEKLVEAIKKAKEVFD